MSSERGRPVHLTAGERDLLGKLLEGEIKRLEAGGMPVDLRPVHGDRAEKFRMLRLRQYRRLRAELRCPQIAEGQFIRDTEDQDGPA